jgi:predicted ester cyclase
MSREANKVLAHRIIEEMWNTRNLKVIDEVYAPEFGGGHEAAKQFVSAILAAFPDLEITIQDQIAENDLVTTRYVMHVRIRYTDASVVKIAI